MARKPRTIAEKALHESRARERILARFDAAPTWADVETIALSAIGKPGRASPEHDLCAAVLHLVRVGMPDAKAPLIRSVLRALLERLGPPPPR